MQEFGFFETDYKAGINYVCGWEHGWTDGYVKVFYYRSSNLIVKHIDATVNPSKELEEAINSSSVIEQEK